MRNRVLSIIALMIVVASSIAIWLRADPATNPATTSDPLPTPDAAAVFEALEASDFNAVETQQAIARAHFESGGGPVGSTRVPASQPDVAAIATAMMSTNARDREQAMADLAFDSAYNGGEQTAVLVRAGLDDMDAGVRRQAAMAAQVAGTQAGVVQEVGDQPLWDWSSDLAMRQALLARFGDTDPATAMWAVVTVDIIYPASSDIRDALVAQFPNTSDAQLQEAIVTALGSDAYGSSEVYSVLTAARESAHPDVRAAAAISTAQSTVPDAENLLNQMLTGESSEVVIDAIAYALRLLE